MTTNTITKTNTTTTILTETKAIELWDRLGDALADMQAAIIEVIETRAWEPLGYSNFFEAWNARIAGRTKIADALRPHVVFQMLDEGRSVTEVATSGAASEEKIAYWAEQKAIGIKPEAVRHNPPTKRRKSSQVSFGLDPAEYAELEELCHRHGTTIQEVGKRGIRAQVWMMKDLTR